MSSPGNGRTKRVTEFQIGTQCLGARQRTLRWRTKLLEVLWPISFKFRVSYCNTRIYRYQGMATKACRGEALILLKFLEMFTLNPMLCYIAYSVACAILATIDDKKTVSTANEAGYSTPYHKYAQNVRILGSRGWFAEC